MFITRGNPLYFISLKQSNKVSIMQMYKIGQYYIDQTHCFCIKYSDSDNKNDTVL